MKNITKYICTNKILWGLLAKICQNSWNNYKGSSGYNKHV